jgi:hypothetical protein
MFTRPFSKSDPRFKVALETHEPLIHFALVCGAKSCPPIKTYSVDVSFINYNIFLSKWLDKLTSTEYVFIGGQLLAR